MSLAWHKAFSQPLPHSACNTTDLTEVDGLLSKNTIESKVRFDKPQRSELQLLLPDTEIRNLTFVQVRIIFPMSKHKQPLQKSTGAASTLGILQQSGSIKLSQT